MTSPTPASAPWRESRPVTPQRSPIHRGRSTAAEGGMHAAPHGVGATHLSPRKAAPQYPADDTRRYQANDEVWLSNAHNRAKSTLSASVMVPRQTAASGEHPLPLHDQPAFRADLVHRSVFVFGLQTLGECRALLQLLQTHCGLVSGAFRAADYSIGGMGKVEGAAGPSAYDRGSVVICVVFYHRDSTLLAKRLDNTAQLYQKRFVVEGAARFRQSSQEPKGCSASASELPQHERLWQLLFSSTVGGAMIDWHAAALAVERGEALLLRSPTFIACSDGGSGSNNTVRHQPLTVHAAPSANQNMGFTHPRMKETTAATTPATKTLSTAAVDLDALGRSNTLQQQYYSERYGASDTPVLSSFFRLASSLVQKSLGGNSGANLQRPTTTSAAALAPTSDETTSNSFIGGSGAGGFMGVGSGYEETYSRAPLRHRVEYTSDWKSKSTPGDTTSGSFGVTGGRSDGSSPDNNSNIDSGAVYIPRMRSVGDYVVAALPFAASILAPLFREREGDMTPGAAPATGGGGDKKPPLSHSRGHIATQSRTNAENWSRSEPVEDSAHGVFYGGVMPEVGHARLGRKRRRYAGHASFHSLAGVPRFGGGSDNGEYDDNDDAFGPMQQIGAGFASLHPDVLCASFAPSTAVGQSSAGAGKGDGAEWMFRSSHMMSHANNTNNRSADLSDASALAVRSLTGQAASNDVVRELVEQQVRLRRLPSRFDDTAHKAVAPVGRRDAPTSFALSRLLRRVCAIYDSSMWSR